MTPLIVVRAEDEAGALALLEDDPFQQAGYIAERTRASGTPSSESWPELLPHRLMC